jgi:hypothetical protein
VFSLKCWILIQKNNESDSETLVLENRTLLLEFESPMCGGPRMKLLQLWNFFSTVNSVSFIIIKKPGSVSETLRETIIVLFILFYAERFETERYGTRHK